MFEFELVNKVLGESGLFWVWCFIGLVFFCGMLYLGLGVVCLVEEVVCFFILGFKFFFFVFMLLLLCNCLL